MRSGSEACSYERLAKIIQIIGKKTQEFLVPHRPFAIPVPATAVPLVRSVLIEAEIGIIARLFGKSRKAHGDILPSMEETRSVTLRFQLVNQPSDVIQSRIRQHERFDEHRNRGDNRRQSVLRLSSIGERILETQRFRSQRIQKRCQSSTFSCIIIGVEKAAVLHSETLHYQNHHILLPEFRPVFGHNHRRKHPFHHSIAHIHRRNVASMAHSPYNRERSVQNQACLRGILGIRIGVTQRDRSRSRRQTAPRTIQKTRKKQHQNDTSANVIPPFSTFERHLRYSIKPKQYHQKPEKHRKKPPIPQSLGQNHIRNIRLIRKF